jgi:hypothetical protein
MVGRAGLPQSARLLLETVSESNSQGSRPIEPIAETANLTGQTALGAASTLQVQTQPTLGGLAHQVLSEFLLLGAPHQGAEGAGVTAAHPKVLIEPMDDLKGSQIFTGHQQELYFRLQGYCFDAAGGAVKLAAKLACEQGWSATKSELVHGEYRRFLFLAMEAAGHPVSASRAVDLAYEHFFDNAGVRDFTHQECQLGNVYSAHESILR